MKTLEVLKAIEKTNRGGTYYEKGALIEGIAVGLMFGVAASLYQYIDNPIFGLLPFVPIFALIMLMPNKFKGFRRCIVFAPPGHDIRYSTIVFSLFYFILVTVVAVLVIQSINLYVKF